MKRCLFALLLVFPCTYPVRSLEPVEFAERIYLDQLGFEEVKLSQENSTVVFNLPRELLGELSFPTFGLDFVALYPADVANSERLPSVLSASINGVTAVQVLISTSSKGASAEGVGWVEGRQVVQSSANEPLVMAYENYLAQGLPNQELIEVMISLEVSELTPGLSVDIRETSWFGADVAPGSSTTLALERAELDYDNNVISVDYVFESDRVEKFKLYAESEGKTAIASGGEETFVAVGGSTFGTIELLTDRTPGQVVIIAETYGFNRPAVSIELTPENGSSARVMWVGAGMLCLACLMLLPARK